jgi:hypothetical protein
MMMLERKIIQFFVVKCNKGNTANDEYTEGMEATGTLVI